MKTEFEVKVLNIDPKEIKAKLISLNAIFLIKRNMKRHVYDIDSNDKSKWIRLRDDGENVTLTFKQITSNEIDGTKEIEIITGDFDKTNEMLESLGFKSKAFQENKRESYKLGEASIEIDSWPKIPPYLEVEGENESVVYQALEKLGIKKEETTSIGVREVYAKYGFDIHSFKELKFD